MARRSGTGQKTTGRRLRRWLLRGLLVILLLPAALAALYRVVPPPGTPLMLIRLVQGDGARREWISLEHMPRVVPLAVMAGEDNRFCSHLGFDSVELRDAVESWLDGGDLRGASTISMQVTRNLFLWPGGGWPRKILEGLWTPAVELVLTKRRIMEIYLNVAEMGRGVFGIEAAAHKHFDKAASDLTRLQAALIAAILPNPRERSAGRPSEYVRSRANTLLRRMRQIAPLDACLYPGR